MIPRIMSAIAVTGALVLLTNTAAAATSTKVCIIGANQVVPATTSGAAGCVRFVIDTTANTDQYRIAFSGLLAAEKIK